MVVDSETLQNAQDSVVDERTFVRFVVELCRNFEASLTIEKQTPSLAHGPAALGWENTTVDGFLEAAAAWAEASTRKPEISPTLSGDGNPWRRCAEILLAGKFYE